jgi:hypothetical protein
MADVDTAFVHQVFDIPERKRKTDVEHYGEADDLGSCFKVLEWRAFCHPKRLGRCAARLKRVLSDSAPMVSVQQTCGMNGRMSAWRLT